MEFELKNNFLKIIKIKEVLEEKTREKIEDTVENTEKNTYLENNSPISENFENTKEGTIHGKDQSNQTINRKKNEINEKYVLKILQNLLKHVDPEKPFNRKQIKNSKIFSESLLSGYLWTLQEQGLLFFNQETENYMFTSEENLKNFIKNVSAEPFEFKSSKQEQVNNENHKKIESNKICEICQKDLPINNFYKEENNEYSSSCKSCHEKKYAANCIIEILELLGGYEEIFEEQIFLNSYPNKEELIWVLKENDLILFDSSNNIHKFAEKSSINEFLNKYGGKNLLNSEFLKLDGFENNISLNEKDSAPISSKNVEKKRKIKSKESLQKQTQSKDNKNISNRLNNNENLSLKTGKSCENIIFDEQLNKWFIQIKKNNMIGPFTNEKKANKFFERINHDSESRQIPSKILKNEQPLYMEYFNIKKQSKQKYLKNNQPSPKSDKLNTEILVNNSKFKDEYSHIYNKLLTKRENNINILNELFNEKSESNNQILEKNQTKKVLFTNDLKKENIEIIMKGLLNTEELFATLLNLKKYSNNIYRIITNQCQNNFFDILIELKIERKEYNSLINYLDKNGW